MIYQGATSVTYNGIEYPLVTEYSTYYRCRVPYIGISTTYNFEVFLRYIKKYSTFPYILCGVTILTYHSGSPASLLNKVYDYRLQYYKVDVQCDSLRLL